jgi:hypothetical protein
MLEVGLSLPSVDCGVVEEFEALEAVLKKASFPTQSVCFCSWALYHRSPSPTLSSNAVEFASSTSGRRDKMKISNLTCLLLSLTGTTIARNLRPAPHRLERRAVEDVDPALLYPERNMSIPVDHFHNDSMYAPHSTAFFNNRYWFDASFYKEGGPVIVLQSGETDASSRLVYLQKGLLHQMVKATNGIGVVFEHRYYGASFPTVDLSTKNLRFLTTDQALADMTYFAKNIVFEGLEEHNLTSPNVPYFAYGGSYSGGFVAFIRKLYPQYWWGSIASSGVTYALWDFWQYYEPIREYGPKACISAQEKLINVADTIMMSGNETRITELKSAFGMKNLTHNDDFANVLSLGIGYWQNRNWDPAVNDPTFDEYCGNITASTLTYEAETSSLSNTATSLIEAGGWGGKLSTTSMLNYIGWVNATFVASCDGTLDSCYGTHNASSPMYADKSLDNYADLTWAYQYCTQWGYIQVGSTVPKNKLSLISRLITLDYETEVCRFAFNLTGTADVEAINKHGGYNITYPRLAHIGGQADPWRPVTPLATLSVPDVLNTTSTTSEPHILIEGAVHHWDENGLFANETTKSLPPSAVADAQKMEVNIIMEWLKEWKSGS